MLLLVRDLLIEGAKLTKRELYYFILGKYPDLFPNQARATHHQMILFDARFDYIFGRIKYCFEVKVGFAKEDPSRDPR